MKKKKIYNSLFSIWMNTNPNMKLILFVLMLLMMNFLQFVGGPFTSLKVTVRSRKKLYVLLSKD